MRTASSTIHETISDLADSGPALRRAADLLRAGRLVAFPTETVYGLGANALDADAVARIFAAKGRPATNPVIVHVSSVDAALPLVAEFPATARKLAAVFWPGPLTLVLPKSPLVSGIVTAGGPTVAIRVPAHPVALALLNEVRLPLATPSANRSTCLSPTRAEHVLRGLDGRIDMILDAGPTTGGIESTVLDLTTPRPTLLRPGLVARRRIEAIVGPIDLRVRRDGETARSPGLMEKHYAPRTPLECVADDGRQRVESLAAQGHRVGWLSMTAATSGSTPNVVRIEMPAGAEAYASCLYDTLHQLDAADLDRIIVALPPEDDDWLAVHDRIHRASEK